MTASESVEISGQLMDSGILSRVLDDIREYDGDYVIDRFDVGKDAGDTSPVLVRQVADGIRESKSSGRKVLWVGGAGVVLTGAAPAMVALVKVLGVDRAVVSFNVRALLETGVLAQAEDRTYSVDRAASTS